MEDEHVATSRIPTNDSPVTRTADIVTYDVAMSLFGLYGVRDFVGPMGRIGLIGADGPASIQGLKRYTVEQGIQGLQGYTGDVGEQGLRGLKGDTGDQGIQGPPGSDVNVPLWVNATQSNVHLIAFGGTLAASRVTNID